MAYRVTNLRHGRSTVMAEHEVQILREKGHASKFKIEEIPQGQATKSEPFIPAAVRHLHAPQTDIVQQAVSTPLPKKSTGQGRKVKATTNA